MRERAKETDVCAAVIRWLQADHGWDVYQEVMAGGRCADIVAVRDPIVWAIEAKTRLGFAVIEQARHWIGAAHYVSIAAPTLRRSDGIRLAEDVLRHHGIGWIQTDAVFGDHVGECVRPRLHRRLAPKRDLRTHLHEEQKHYAAAGSPGSDRWSPFKRTIAAIHKTLTTSPGLTIKELVAAIDHHYATPSTARSAIAKWIVSGVIPNVRIEGTRPQRLYFERNVSTEARP